MASSGSGQTFANSFVIGHRAAALGHRHRRTIGQRTERPRCRCAAEQRDELATAAHSITSSARASSVGGMSMPSDFAVLRLMERVRIGRGLLPLEGRAGLAPLRIRPT